MLNTKNNTRTKLVAKVEAIIAEARYRFTDIDDIQAFIQVKLQRAQQLSHATFDAKLKGIYLTLAVMLDEVYVALLGRR